MESEVKQTRICLRCRKEFVIKHKGNFICTECTIINAKKSGKLPINIGLSNQPRGGVKEER